MTAGQLREAAKAAARQARKQQRDFEKANPTPPKQEVTFKDFIAIAKQHGWVSGYQAPDNSEMQMAFMQLVKKANWAKLCREMSIYTGFDYNGGVADLVGGAHMRSKSETQFQTAWLANQAGHGILFTL